MTLPLPPASFAQDWAAAWNAHDLPRILSHYAPGIRFRSDKALALTGRSEIEGHDALRAYWSAALTQQPDLKFNVQAFYRGPGMAVITYQNQHAVQTAETLIFDHSGLIHFGAACRI